MKSTKINLIQNDGYRTTLFCFETSADTVLGSLLLLHGMAEHYGRYLDFIQALTKEGFDVYTYNHRGHGTDKKLSELGYIAKRKGASLLVEDALTVCRYIKENARNNKLAVFGHSMGSLILRCMLQTYDDLDCAIVSSSTMPPALVSQAGISLSGLLCMFRGPKKRSEFLKKVLFGGKAYTSLCTRTSYDWLTRNNTVIGQYMDDPYCGFTCTTSFYRDLAQLSKHAALKSRMAKTRKDMPLLFLTGEKDPVGGYSSQLLRLKKRYDKLGFTDTHLIIYQGARHELLNELNADEVYRDIVQFLHTRLQEQ